MKRAFGVVCIISVIYLAALLVGFYRYSLNEQSELQQLILSYAIDYCSDAAMQEALTGDHLEMDYTKDHYMIVDPKQALDTFVDLFCLNYDIGISCEARKHVLQNYIPVACMAAYDGFYIAKYQPVKNAVNYPENGLNDSTWDVVFGPKLPYTYTNAGTAYALNMGMEYAYAINGYNVSKYKGIPPGLLNKEAGIAEINKIVAGEMAYTIDSVNAANPNWRNSFFIPAQLTSLTGVSPITGPSLIVLVQNVDLTTVRPISGFSVSGTKVDQAMMVLAYRRGGIKYYCYADRFPGGVPIEDVYSTVEDAARAGYNHDILYMN